MFKKDSKIPENKRQEIFLKIKPLIAQELQINEDKITLDAKIKEDLGADSLDGMEIMMALEDAFNIEIMDDDAERMQNINDIVNYLAGRGI